MPPAQLPTERTAERAGPRFRLQHSGVQTHPGELPRQWLPGFIRWPVRVLLYPYVMLDVAVRGLLTRVFPLPYVISGSCGKRGDCCRYILVDLPVLLERFRPLRALCMWYLTQLHGFYPRSFEVETEGSRLMVLGCRYLRPDGLCAHHVLRPYVCRNWPRRQYDAIPVLLDGCGYAITPRAGGDAPQPSRPGRLPILP